MKVVTSCGGRFHIFDQARQLHRYGVLHRLVNTYPKFMTRRWDIPDEKVVSLLCRGAYGRLVGWGGAVLSRRVRDSLKRHVHGQFSSRLAHCVPRDADVFIGLASYCLEAVGWARKNGVKAVVDHGSLYAPVERRLLEEEREIWGMRPGPDLPADWLIEKQDEEFRAADRIMLLSQVAKRGMVEGGFPAEKIFVNPCGVDLSEFQPGPKNDRVFRVIQCGGIRAEKGVQYLLKAFDELRLPNSELWFIGGGLESSSLQRIIREYRSDNIVFKGSVPRSQLQKLYSQGSVSVLASVADGFGMVVPQAMACGLPVIVSENVGAADLVTSEHDGFVIPIRDVEALKEKIVALYRNQEMCRTMGYNARRSVQTGYTWDDYGDRLLGFLKEL